MHEKVKANLVSSIMGKEFQFSLGEMLAEYISGRRGYTILPNREGDIDIIILDAKGKKPIIGYEAKIGKIEAEDAKGCRENSFIWYSKGGNHKCKRKTRKRSRIMRGTRTRRNNRNSRKGKQEKIKSNPK